MDEELFRAQLQPIVNISTRQTHSFEVLSRCVQALDIESFFKTVTPRSGADISIKVLRDTMAGFINNPHTLQFNLSPKQLLFPTTLNKLTHILTKSGYPPSMLICELTEIDDTDIFQLAEVMCKLTSMGLRFSLDDFGTGKSGYERLFKLPISQLKIDRQFIAEIDRCTKQQKLVSHLIDLSEMFGAEVVVEGVETKNQHDTLHEIGVTLAQGYFYQKPYPLREIREPYSSSCVESSVWPLPYIPAYSK